MSDGKGFEDLAGELVDAMEGDPKAAKAKRQSGPASQPKGVIRRIAERHGISEDEARETLDEMGF